MFYYLWIPINIDNIDFLSLRWTSKSLNFFELKTRNKYQWIFFSFTLQYANPLKIISGNIHVVGEITKCSIEFLSCLKREIYSNNIPQQIIYKITRDSGYSKEKIWILLGKSCVEVVFVDYNLNPMKLQQLTSNFLYLQKSTSNFITPNGSYILANKWNFFQNQFINSWLLR